jgi:hypothetical protein
MAPVAISWRDLSAWCEFSGERLQWWEAKLLMRLSALRAQIVMEKAERDRQHKIRTDR